VYQVRLLETAVRDLAKLDKPVARRIGKRLHWLAENFELIKPLPLIGNFTGLYKLRVGDYRVIYEVIPAENVLIIHLIGHRSDVYR